MSISLIYNFLQGVTTSNASTTTTMPPSPPNPPPLNTTLNQTPVATSRSSLTTYTTNCFKRKKTSLSNIQAKQEISYVSKEWQRIWKEGLENLDYEEYHGSSSIPPVPYKSAWESKNCGLQILGWNGPPIPGKDLSADKRRSLVCAMQLGRIVMKPL